MDTLPLFVRCLIALAVFVGACWFYISLCIVAGRADEQAEKML